MVSIVFFQFSCRENRGGAEEFPKVVTEFDRLPEDFRDFHKRFHKDSVFQMNRINFPLRGLPAHFTEEDMNFAWEDSSWVLHKEYDTTTELFRREWTVHAGNEIEESIFSMEADFGMTRIFKQSGGYWYLVYYAAMNRLNSAGNPVGKEKEGINEKDSLEERNF